MKLADYFGEFRDGFAGAFGALEIFLKLAGAAQGAHHESRSVIKSSTVSNFGSVLGVSLMAARVVAFGTLSSSGNSPRNRIWFKNNWMDSEVVIPNSFKMPSASAFNSG